MLWHNYIDIYNMYKEVSMFLLLFLSVVDTADMVDTEAMGDTTTTRGTRRGDRGAPVGPAGSDRPPAVTGLLEGSAEAVRLAAVALRLAVEALVQERHLVS